MREITTHLGKEVHKNSHFHFSRIHYRLRRAKAGARWCFTETLISKSTKPPRQTHMMVLFSEAAAFPFTTLPLTDIAPKL